MLIFTVSSGNITNGAKVTEKKIAGGTVILPVIAVGEEGRGRDLAFLPVDQGCVNYITDEQILLEAELGQTRAGSAKFMKPVEFDAGNCIVVMRTPIGFRGDNSHHGDVIASKCRECGMIYQGDFFSQTQVCTCEYPVRSVFSDFPGKILATGRIAQGMAGNMGSGNQIIAVIPKDVVFSVQIGGSLYGSPDKYFYKFNGSTIEVFTSEERIAVDKW